MTPEEISKTIEQMLAVQRQIQESQIRNTDNINQLEDQIEANARQIEANARQIEANAQQIQELRKSNREDINNVKDNINTLIIEIAKLTVNQKEKFNQFYGYHQSADSERLDILERLINVEKELANIKRQLGHSS